MSAALVLVTYSIRVHAYCETRILVPKPKLVRTVVDTKRALLMAISLVSQGQFNIQHMMTSGFVCTPTMVQDNI